MDSGLGIWVRTEDVRTLSMPLHFLTRAVSTRILPPEGIILSWVEMYIEESLDG